VAEQVIWAASSLHDIFMTHGKDIAQRRQTMFEPGYTEKVVNYCSGVAYTYKDSFARPAGLTELDGPAIGDRAPDVDLEDGSRLFDRLRHGRFTLLVMPGRDPDTAVAPLKKRFGRLVEVATLPRSEALDRRYGASDGRLVLIRPDGYLDFACRAEETSLLERHLASLLTL
jgi:hypothetical protein